MEGRYSSRDGENIVKDVGKSSLGIKGTLFCRDSIQNNISRNKGEFSRNGDVFFRDNENFSKDDEDSSAGTTDSPPRTTRTFSGTMDAPPRTT